MCVCLFLSFIFFLYEFSLLTQSVLGLLCKIEVSLYTTALCDSALLSLLFISFGVLFDVVIELLSSFWRLLIFFLLLFFLSTSSNVWILYNPNLYPPKICCFGSYKFNEFLASNRNCINVEKNPNTYPNVFPVWLLLLLCVFCAPSAHRLKCNPTASLPKTLQVAQLRSF